MEVPCTGVPHFELQESWGEAERGTGWGAAWAEGLGVGGGERGRVPPRLGLPGGSLRRDAWAAGPLLPTLAPPSFLHSSDCPTMTLGKFLR